MIKQPRDVHGRFESPYREPKGSPIAMRLPQSLDEVVRQKAEAEGKQPNQWIVDFLSEQLKEGELKAG